MILDSSNDDTSVSHRVFRRFLADMIADVPVQLDKFRKEIVEPALAREKHVEDVMVLLRAFLKAREESNDAESQRLSQDLRQEDRFITEVKLHFSSDYWYRKGKVIAAPLFWAIIQQYAMPPRVRTVIEGASRFWSKTRIMVRLKAKPYSDAGHLEYCEAYLKLCGELRKQLDAGQMSVDKGQLHSSPDATTKLKAGSFTLINTGGFDDDLMKGVVETVEKAEHAMRGIGLGKVCYGDIMVTKTIKSKTTVAAFYVLVNDEMFVRANVKPHWDTVQVVCHELAHRYQNKFLKGKQREIDDIYRQISRASRITEDFPIEMYPMAGDTIVDPKYGELQVVKPDYSKQSVKLISDQMPGVSLSLPLAAWLKAKHIQWPPHDDTKLQWVTGYAKKDPDENFAEMVSFHALGKLPPPLISLLEPLL